MSVRLSLIIPTYRRPQEIAALLGCLAAQSWRDFEIIIIDASGEDPAVRGEVARFRAGPGQDLALQLLASDKWVTRQRNLGLRAARGTLLGFLDDDVTFGPDFLALAASLFDRPELADVGGITGYDTRNYGMPVSARDRLLRLLGVFPSLRPGALGRTGLHVPVVYQQPFSGCIDVGWFPGLCMFFRREAAAGVWFDEGQPNKGFEDVDYSTAIGRRWRLVMCGDLRLEHHLAAAARPPAAQGQYETSYGLARLRLRRRRTLSACLGLVWYGLVQFVIDALSLARHPSRLRLGLLLARPRGLLDGARSALREAVVN